MARLVRNLLIAMCLVLAGAATAQERLALVVGNSAYSTVPALDNPVRDATLIASTLSELGFEVTVLTDASQGDLRAGIAAFGRALRQAGPDATGLFYYAGHGVQSFGSNYLLPVDVVLQDAADLGLVAVAADAVLQQMYSARNRTNIVILDACRNNPFSLIPEFNETGLAEMKAPTGTFLSYATEPGGVALDGEAGNSPFTEALAVHMRDPGLPIEQVFKEVRIDVLAATGGRQTPWDTSSLTQNFSFRPQVPMTAEQIAERQFWESVQASRDPVQVMLFLRAYPDGPYESEARSLLNEAMQQELGSGTKPKLAAPAVNPQPEADEQAAFQAAQSAGTLEAFEAYLAAFPQGTFSELAQSEIASIRNNSGTDPDGEGVTPEPPAGTATAAADLPSDVTFDAPLVIGEDWVRGHSLAELIDGTPLYPPFEGLPEELWKNRHCSDCHDWQRDNLCTQAQVYLQPNAERSLAKQHPLGDSFKENLRLWAANDCR